MQKVIHNPFDRPLSMNKNMFISRKVHIYPGDLTA